MRLAVPLQTLRFSVPKQREIILKYRYYHESSSVHHLKLENYIYIAQFSDFCSLNMQIILHNFNKTALEHKSELK